ncbi:MAG TPA: DUF2891 domain-containing protein [Casimicrobiaceae bacterium]|nr:DUF2891 domain-containing protein [Casimicrobiaceae bacterium]
MSAAGPPQGANCAPSGGWGSSLNRHAAKFRAIALANVAREYPGKLDHVMNSAADVASPRALHPAFYGSYDWHSCVHMHWLLVRLKRVCPECDADGAIARMLGANLSRESIAGEVAYLSRAATQAFERPYGWAWLLKLAEETQRSNGSEFFAWRSALAPLADAFTARYLDWLPKATHPLRVGMHINSAFGLAFALDYARAMKEAALEAMCIARAQDWYGKDVDYPARWEPSGSDFFSPALIEADLMLRVLPAAEFAIWLDAFLPGLVDGEPATLFTPAVPSDRSDGQIVHLDGLNLSRAWCFAHIASALPHGDARVQPLQRAAAQHLAAGLQGVASADYMGAHWLATFATLALDGC